MWLLQKMVEMDIAIVSSLGSGLGGSQLTTLSNPAPNVGRFANWFYRGAESDALGGDALVEDLGQSLLSNNAYKEVATLSNLERGEVLLQSLKDNPLNLFSFRGGDLGISSGLISTGPTALARSAIMNPFVRPAGAFIAQQFVVPNPENTNVLNILGPEPQNTSQRIKYCKEYNCK